ncbi:molybdenum cofactor guanylyltransferase [Nocardiopsis terrae]|uniref:Molybdopterin-guanine dinucleotide biosynthesis protein A n=1 Tax=Nocardiopsis terrae TaxID=372655 RepID=A0ABR9HIV8_9ACTN|nr:NTP transferase domain-containing protein [Nocardiopsis terrae]MBE1458958.1 molybdopterin-guanine dinucleotide biosynthesis protein A [Nocardiopsis terrae]GHC87304.1 molybdenum cofactor guanylyltransferase [Nocardiopsis terrae]
MIENLDAVVLAGGAAARMGGADKPGLAVAGRTLLERVVDAVRDHHPGAHVTVVGPERDRPRARYVREDPPGGGPVPALRAGLPHVGAPWFALLAADLPYLAPEHLAALGAAAPGHDGAVLVDAAGRAQWLTGVWRTEALRTALANYGGRSLYGLLEPLDPARVPLAGDPGDFDVDTPEALERVRAELGPPDRPGHPGP